MYKYVLTFSLFLSSFSFGQLHSLGFHGGAMGTSVGSTFFNGDSKYKIDFTGGLNYQYRFTSALTVGANVEYTQFGARVPVDFVDQTGQLIATAYSSWDWNYVSIPLIVGYEMGGKVSIKPKAALVPSVLTRAVYNFIPYDGSSLTPYKDSYYSSANKFDLAGMAGFDVSARFHSGTLFAAFDFRYSITQLNSDTFFPTTVNDVYRNKSLGACVGVRFNLGNPEGDGPTDIIDDPID